jgi:alpha-tubulin suppressor-like RCC1 family protein
MRHIGLIPSRSAAPSSAGRAARLLRQLAPILPLALAAALGCRDDAPSPTAPDSEPALVTTATTAALSFRQVSVSAGSTEPGHACGVTTDDRAYCWGNNEDGQLGNGTNSGPEDCNGWPCSIRPVAVLGGLRFDHVSAGGRSTCGITTDDRAYCWGRNENGQLGDGTQIMRLTPVAVAGGRRFRQVRAGNGHACAITPLDVAFCWGYNVNGQLGDGTTTQRLTPVRVAGGHLWRQLSGGFGYSCGVTTDDQPYCWGYNVNGQLGDGTTISRLRPVAVSGGLLFRQIDAGFHHTCAVRTTDDRAYCWGLNQDGALGDGTTTSRLKPVAVLGTRRFDHVSAGGNHTCGVTLAGRGFCWGVNLVGQLGDGTTTRRLQPTPLGVDLTLSQVSAGFGSSCGVATDHRAYCWGHNYVGQLGDGTNTPHLLPVPVAAPT